MPEGLGEGEPEPNHLTLTPLLCSLYPSSNLLPLPLSGNGVRGTHQAVHHRSLQPLWAHPRSARGDHVEVQSSGLFPSLSPPSTFYCSPLYHTISYALSVTPCLSFNLSPGRRVSLVSTGHTLLGSMVERTRDHTPSSSRVAMRMMRTTETSSPTQEVGGGTCRATREQPNNPMTRSSHT